MRVPDLARIIGPPHAIDVTTDVVVSIAWTALPGLDATPVVGVQQGLHHAVVVDKRLTEGRIHSTPGLAAPDPDT